LIKIEVPNQINPKFLFIKGSCYARQAYISYFRPFIFPKVEDVDKKHEDSLDFIHIDDQKNILSFKNNQIYIKFVKPVGKDDKNPLCFKRKLTFGNCEMIDPKGAKAATYEITMPANDRDGYFVC
jgi:hypothetical protein